jgi:imidazole glycerol-phosphate synthase subunit HisH
MNTIVGVINYGIAGNIHSITRALEKAGGKVKIINKCEELYQVDKIVIPGVGSFKDAMRELENDGLLESLKEVLSTKPILGICLGMQILSEIGLEYGKTQGLGVIEAEVTQLETDENVPHVGFAEINVLHHNKLLENLEHEEFYFMHSFKVKIKNKDLITSTTTYGGDEFVSSLQKNNIYGVQFHPEKSREAGIQLFKNFLNI